MISSMTAFAKTEAACPEGDISCEIRAVNHRYLDLNLKLPEALRSLEPDVMASIKKHFTRGKIDVLFRLTATTTNLDSLALNQPLVSQLIQTSASLSTQANNQITPLSAEAILKWPGVIQAKPIILDSIKKTLLAMLEEALIQACKARQAEGSALDKLIIERVQAMHEHLSAIKTILPSVETTHQKMLADKFANAQLTLDPLRLEQEMVLYIQKIDITEELDRLNTHLDSLTSILSKGGSVGRKLDFLMQELNRETNTIASKSADISITKHALDMKVLIEQMREQIQNIE